MKKQVKIITFPDVVIICALVLTSFVLSFFIFEDGSAELAKITSSDGVFYLKDGDECTVTSNSYTLNIAFKDGQAYVEFSDCPGNDCVNRGPIGNKGEIIICIPACVTVELCSASKESYDAVLG